MKLYNNIKSINIFAIVCYSKTFHVLEVITIKTVLESHYRNITHYSYHETTQNLVKQETMFKSREGNDHMVLTQSRQIDFGRGPILLISETK